MRKVFSRDQVAHILAAHMGGVLVSWHVDGHSTQWDMVVETAERVPMAQVSPQDFMREHAKTDILGDALAARVSQVHADAYAAREKLRKSIQAASETIARRREHAEAVCVPRGAFDVRNVELGEGIGHAQRIERLEAAVLLMASHDPTGPLQSIGDFMGLRLGLEREPMCHYPATTARG